MQLGTPEAIGSAKTLCFVALQQHDNVVQDPRDNDFLQYAQLMLLAP